jgi:hypothetical protein
MKLNAEELLGCILGHTDHLEVGELSECEWAAKLIEDQHHTVSNLILYDQTHDKRYNSYDYNALKSLKTNFPQYNI